MVHAGQAGGHSHGLGFPGARGYLTATTGVPCSSPSPTWHRPRRNTDATGTLQLTATLPLSVLVASDSVSAPVRKADFFFSPPPPPVHSGTFYIVKGVLG